MSEKTPSSKPKHDCLSIKSVHSSEEDTPRLTPIPSHISNTHDAPMLELNSYTELPDEVYDRLSPSRKVVIVTLLSFCSLLVPMSSTTVFAAVPEVATTYHSTGAIINLSNALYMGFMGLSPMFWGPLAQVYGRKPICLITLALFFGCSIGTALSPNLASFFIFRLLTAFEGTALLTVGSSCISDIYRQSERGTAMGWFFAGTLIGCGIAPCLGGLIVTYTNWRVIFCLQTALAGAASIGAFLLLPETIHHRKCKDLASLPRSKKARVLWSMINPWRVIALFRYPNLVTVAAASSSLVFNMYSLLTPIRYVLFNLTTPIQSGLFYLAPGAGYFVGTLFGGRYADHVLNSWTAKRGGQRVPEDRLRSALPFVGVVIPICMLIYGWSVEREFGGIPLPVIMMFLQGVAQLMCFPSLNTYCLDVMQSRSAEVIATNYMTRYMFAALGSAVVLPAVESIGVGWFSTISAGFLTASGAALWWCIIRGRRWREGVDRKRRVDKRRRSADSDGPRAEEKGIASPVALEKDVGSV